MDVTAFDGAQAAGKNVGKNWFPRTTVVKGAEHVTSLFLNDLFKISPEFKALKIFNHALHSFLGGSHHAPHTIFKKYSKMHNKGKLIGLIWAVGARMGEGEVISLCHTLRLHGDIKQTINSAELMQSKATKARFLFSSSLCG